MRNPSGQDAQALQLLRLLHLRFQPATVGSVHRDAGQGDGLSIGIERSASGEHPADFPIRPNRAVFYFEVPIGRYRPSGPLGNSLPVIRMEQRKELFHGLGMRAGSQSENTLKLWRPGEATGG